MGAPPAAPDPPCLLCSEVVARRYKTLYQSVKNVYLKLLPLGLMALNYNGDTDMACNFLGNEWFVEDLGLQVQKKTSFTFDTQCLVCSPAPPKTPSKLLF